MRCLLAERTGSPVNPVTRRSDARRANSLGSVPRQRQHRSQDTRDWGAPGHTRVIGRGVPELQPDRQYLQLD